MESTFTIKKDTRFTWGKFLIAYIKSMRLYYAFVTGICGWVGFAYYEYLAQSPIRTVEILPTPGRKALMITLFFLSWGINQIINDYLGREEDKINAPHRPMVSGELNPGKAVGLSVILLGLTGLITWVYLEPIALLPLIVGVGLNVLYEYAKGYGSLGNLVFGMMIAMCSVYGFLAAGPTSLTTLTSNHLSLFILLLVINGVMTFYTYFKDYTGDRAANKITIVVKYGLERSRIIALVLSVIPVLTYLGLVATGLLHFELNQNFIFLGVLTLFLQIWTGFLYYKYPVGEKTYYSLSTNFRACSCGQATLIALFNPQLGMMLFIGTYIFVGFLFDLYSNSKA